MRVRVRYKVRVRYRARLTGRPSSSPCAKHFSELATLTSRCPRVATAPATNLPAYETEHPMCAGQSFTNEVTWLGLGLG